MVISINGQCLEIRVGNVYIYFQQYLGYELCAGILLLFFVFIFKVVKDVPGYFPFIVSGEECYGFVSLVHRVFRVLVGQVFEGATRYGTFTYVFVCISTY